MTDFTGIVYVLIPSCNFIMGAGPRSVVGSASGSRARGPGLDTRSGHLLLFLLPLIQEGQLSVTSEVLVSKPVQEKCG